MTTQGPAIVTQTSPPETPPTAPMFPPGRYGHRREPVRARRRWTVPVMVVAIVAVMGLVAVRLFLEYGNDQFTPNVIGTSDITSTGVTVKFRVQKPGGAAATCTVQALAYSQAEVGAAQVPVPKGTDVTVTYRLATTARAYAAEIPDCQEAR
jgi:hypothetical protein